MDLKLNLASFSTPTVSLDENHVYELIILGGGPAALNAALYAARKKIDVAIITQDIGGQIIQSSTIENWLGTAVSDSSALVNRFYEHIEEYNIIIKKETTITSIELDSPTKKIITDKGTFQAKSIIVATGKSPRKLGILGEDEFVGKGVAYCTTCDGPAFQDKSVVVVGGGNSGVEAAIDMLSYAHKLVVVQNLEELTADGVLVEKLLADSRVSVVYNSVCERIEGTYGVERLVIKNKSTNEESIIETDGVFVEIGLQPASDFVPSSIKNDCGEILINSRCETSIAGVFAAGDVTDVPYKQVVIAAGEGAKAALSAYNYLISH